MTIALQQQGGVVATAPNGYQGAYVPANAEFYENRGVDAGSYFIGPASATAAPVVGLLYDLGAQASLSSVGIYGAYWSAGGATAAATWTVEGSLDNVSFTTLGTLTTSASGPITTTASVTGVYRYIRLSCTSAASAGQMLIDMFDVQGVYVYTYPLAGTNAGYGAEAGTIAYRGPVTGAGSGAGAQSGIIGNVGVGGGSASALGTQTGAILFSATLTGTNPGSGSQAGAILMRGILVGPGTGSSTQTGAMSLGHTAWVSTPPTSPLWSGLL